MKSTTAAERSAIVERYRVAIRLRRRRVRQDKGLNFDEDEFVCGRDRGRRGSQSEFSAKGPTPRQYNWPCDGPITSTACSDADESR